MNTIKRILGDRLLIRRKPTEQAGAIVTMPSIDDREPAFEAVVVGVGARLSESIRPGDTVILAAPVSQDRVGTRKVIWNGEPAELVSTLDVLAVLESNTWPRCPKPTMCGGDPIGSAIVQDDPEKYAREARGRWIV